VDHRLVGLVVSSVSDVLALAEDEILPAPEIGAKRIAGAISGIGARKAGEGAGADTVLLLDVAHIMKRIREERE
jgi:chemotaxis signal transduction protein